uniref:NADH-ubiquinone oxidoreductase chain 5 n=1 Tax=Attagenus augustatus augustatus TaxID=2783534 RepID=A0A7S6UAY6_9COLE|nr:NADH dehydrogenase subunit 5 [Attagenus augustatus augustatus]
MGSVCYNFFFFFFFFSVLWFFVGLGFLSFDFSLILEFNLFSIGSCSVVMSILLDWMSLLFMSFVLFISSMVIYYSEEYMSGDLNMNRFIFLVAMFVLSMILLIISPNLISILLGWDGLGLVSYCLVIYYQNMKSYNAGMLTFLTNRLGDVALLISIAWMVNYGGWNFYFWIDCMSEDFSMSIISGLVILAGMTKSAQIPFSAWLPAAMAAPTPVSSLVHSSTLVTAGVYLLIRFSVCFSIGAMFFLMFFSTLTMFMAGLCANLEFDLKKIIAFSTLSQLGLMVSIFSLGSYKLAFFHLLTHALFKALLFMCAGSIIHNFLNCQDIRYMGGLIIYMPLTCSFFNISNMSLCGIPFMAGFYSKDLMLEILSMSYINFFIYLIFFISTGLTVSYTFRLLYYGVFGDYNFLSLSGTHEQGYIMLRGMMGLIFFVIFCGSVLMWISFPTPYFICLPLFFKLMALFVTLMGMWMGFTISNFSLGYSLMSFDFLRYSLFFSYMWNLPFISTFGINYFPFYKGGLMFKVLDQGWFEYFGGQKINLRMKESSLMFQYLYLNNLKIYLVMMVIIIIFVLVL